MLNHLINIQRLDKSSIDELIQVAQSFKIGNFCSGCAKKTAVLMFFENSTRTKCSFELAAKKLGMHVINFETQYSSLSKGESFKDTLENLYFIGADVAIVRHSENDIIDKIISGMSYPLKFVNAGTGNSAHPTQALLDYFTMKEKLGNIEGKKVTIVGDIAHSRVAKSNLELLSKMGAKVCFCAPDYFTPDNYGDFNAVWENNLQKAITNADVVMLLRIQKERLEKDYNLPIEDYIKNYQLTKELLEENAPNAILMHPGPVNREIEITSELLDSEKGKTILEQVQNGVYVRMAVLNSLLTEVR